MIFLKASVKPASAFFQIFSYATEDLEKVKTAFFNILSEDLREKINLQISKTEGYFNDPIHIISAKLTRRENVESLLNYLAKKLPKRTKVALSKKIKQMIDERGNLYLRFSKEDAYEGKLVLGDRNVIWCKIHFSGRGKKIEEITEYLKRIGFIAEEEK